MDKDFAIWYQTIAPRLGLGSDPSKSAYDYYGYYNKYVKSDIVGWLKQAQTEIEKNPEVHLFTDEFKLPLHPTFSEESIYNRLQSGIAGGKWDYKNGKENFMPSPFNLNPAIILNDVKLRR